MAIILRKNKKKKKPTYQVKVRDQFGRFFGTKSFDNKNAAKTYKRRLLEERDKGLNSFSIKKTEITFEAYWRKWDNELRNSISKGWKDSQVQMAKKYVFPFIANYKLNEIQPFHIRDLLKRMELQGYSAQLVVHVYNLLHKMFDDAIHYYDLRMKNPAIKRYRPEIIKTERAFLKPPDSIKLLKCSKDDYLGPAIWLSLLAALRPGEVQALLWDAIDFENNMISIRATFNRKTKIIQNHPKQGNWGKAPITPWLKEYLLERKVKNNSTFVASNKDGLMLSYNTYRKRLKYLCEMAKVKSLTPHELRHSCTELYISHGASVEDIRRLLNQKSLVATARYIHRTDERLSRIANSIFSDHENEKPFSGLRLIS